MRLVQVGEDALFERERQSEERRQLLFRRHGRLDHVFRHLW